MSVMEKSAKAFLTGLKTVRLMEANANNHPRNNTKRVTIRWSTLTHPANLRKDMARSFFTCVSILICFNAKKLIVKSSPCQHTA